jgi:hypothetical protein
MLEHLTAFKIISFLFCVVCITYFGQIPEDGTAGGNDVRLGRSLIKILVEVQVNQIFVRGLESPSLMVIHVLCYRSTELFFMYVIPDLLE